MFDMHVLKLPTVAYQTWQKWNAPNYVTYVEKCLHKMVVYTSYDNSFLRKSTSYRCYICAKQFLQAGHLKTLDDSIGWKTTSVSQLWASFYTKRRLDRWNISAFTQEKSHISVISVSKDSFSLAAWSNIWRPMRGQIDTWNTPRG